ncbi:uncharacterized protein SOCG_02818 [Schizosaccharomyces octosporus yFS286]|uniref:Uncharacterized protein n=1 Tax=Schizosaccharomyces octosporus (strain yFS286) TaxID=483514 RepID=S9R5N5_SCHOY|nr:uncharacterized protein SOCG_02818 [Schizosaccharomyces octosporus yFS286]EPX73600.1 hypothetical protein SOCG_02818 [Schizosaccharomyces octosporus yFS286]
MTSQVTIVIFQIKQQKLHGIVHWFVTHENGSNYGKLEYQNAARYWEFDSA